MNGWHIEGEPRELAGGAEVQYLRSQHHHEGSHEIRFSDTETLWVGPDGVTTARGRIGTAAEAYGDAHGALLDPVAYVVGRLVLVGATNLKLNGEPVIRRRDGTVQWVVELHDDGEMRATWTGS